jgi:hypothetical protein
MTLYTIVMAGDVLVASVPDGSDVDAEITAEENRAGVEFENVYCHSGLELVNTVEPDDEIMYSGSEMGWLRDENGNHFKYAVRRVR